MSDKPKKTSDESSLKTLKLEEIVSERNVGRRSALGWIGASFLGAAVATIVTPQSAEAQAVSDSDSTDRAGHGRTGVTDRDTGSGADGPNHGVCPSRGHTDSDSGAQADGAGHGRGPCHR